MRKRLFLILGIGIWLIASATGLLSQKGYVVVSGADFYGTNYQQAYENAWGIVFSITGSASVICPVHFPPSADGKKIRSLQITFYDNNSDASSGWLRVRLYRMDRWSYAPKHCCTILPDGFWPEDPKYATVAGSAITGPRLIKSNRYAWSLYVDLLQPSNLRLYSVTIMYE